MKPMLPWLLVVAAAVYITVDLVRGTDTAALDAAEARADTLLAERDSVMAIVDSIRPLADRSDTVLVRVVDSVRVVVEESEEAASLADSSFTSAHDSLGAHLAGDTLGLRLLARVEESHDSTVVAKDRTISALRVQLGETEASRMLWRNEALESRVVIDAQDGALTQKDRIIEMQADQLSARKRRQWTERVVVVLGVGAALVLG